MGVMHYSSYSHVCHFLLQDPSSHCMEYYPLVSSDSSINHDFVLFVEPETLRERRSSHAAHIAVQREIKGQLLFSAFAITQGTGYWRLTKQCRQYTCTASVEQDVVPRPPSLRLGLSGTDVAYVYKQQGRRHCPRPPLCCHENRSLRCTLQPPGDS